MKGMSNSRQMRKNQIFFFLDELLKSNRKAQLNVMEQFSALMHVKGIVQA